MNKIPTPALLIERSRLEANLAGMQSRANVAGVALRPHTKTHKCVEIAKLQRDAGARGITVAKASEAEVFAEAGFKDIRIAYCVVGREKMERIAALSQKCRISFCVDTVEGARLAAEALAEYLDHDAAIEVLIEVDTGQGRTGVPWDQPEDLVELASEVKQLPALKLQGILTHGGYGYYGPKNGESRDEALRRAASTEYERTTRVADGLKEAGFALHEISIGSTPTLRHLDEPLAHITEIRPGNYVFHDRTQVGLGVADWKDCALTVLATVISRRRDSDGTERLYLDAGKKVFTSDNAFGHEGYGELLYNPRAMVTLPHAEIVGLSEEHAWVHVSGGATLAIGDTVRVVPNHACVVVNNFDQMTLVDGEDVVENLEVNARGCLT